MFRFKKTLLIFMAFIGSFQFSLAQIPAYYSSIDFQLDGAALQTQLSNLITTTHTTLIPYTSSSTDTWDILRISDLESASSNSVLLVYGYDDNDGEFITDRSRDAFDTCHTSSCIGLWNREHVFAKSLANPSLVTNDPGSGTDVHNLRAVDSQKNSQRSNRLFAESSGNSVVMGDYFYPGDEWKGDVARIIMYMYLRYPTQCEAINSASGSVSYAPNGDMPDLFLEWNQQDPVSDFETNRNDIIFSYQGNRNPFIDNPVLATQIWGGPEAEDLWGLLSSSIQNQPIFQILPTASTNLYEIKGLDSGAFNVVIYNMLGQNLQYNHDSSKTIDVSQLSRGVYIAKIEQGDHASQVRFVVQ